MTLKWMPGLRHSVYLYMTIQWKQCVQVLDCIQVDRRQSSDKRINTTNIGSVASFR